MSVRDARHEIGELKKTIQVRFPETILRVGPRPYGDANDVFLYAYTPETQMDDIVQMVNARVTDILLKTGVYLHVIPLRPGSMAWLWDNDKKRKARRTAVPKPRVLAESRAAYKTRKPPSRRKPVRQVRA